MFCIKDDVFLLKKSTRQGCTTQITELGMHQNHHFQQIPLKINKHPKINPPSTITIPESAEKGSVVLSVLLAEPSPGFWGFLRSLLIDFPAH